MNNLFVYILAIAIVVAVVTSFVIRRFNRSSRVFDVIMVCVITVYALVLVFVLPAVDEEYKPIDTVAMYLLTALIVVFTVVITNVADREGKFETRSITYAGICIALSFALSYVRLFRLPQGGSVTLASLLPLVMYCCMFGCKRGIVVCAVYGLLQFVQSPEFYQPMQVLIDYPIAFGVVGLSGVFKQAKLCKGNIIIEFVLGSVVAGVMRYCASVISGYFVFGSFRMEGYTSLSWALVYNLFVLVDIAVVLVCGVAVLSSPTVRKYVRIAQTV